MALKQFSPAIDLSGHINFASQVNGQPLPAANSGWDIANNSPSQQRGVVHHFGVDRIIVSADNIGAAGPGSNRGTFSLDPLFQDESAQGSYFVQCPVTPGQDDRRHIALGQYNPSTGQQRLYAAPSARNTIHPWEELNPATLAGIAFPIYPGLEAGAVVGIAPGNDGYWTVVSGPGTSHIFFEGMTTGGHDNVPAGSYPDGLVLSYINVSQFEGGTDGSNSIGWVDIATTAFVGWLNIPGSTSATAGNNTEPLIDGRSFGWAPIYYMHDDDATFAAPKGQLMLQSLTTIDDGTNVVSYIRTVDFNPFGISGSPMRTHLRERSLTKLLQPYAPYAPGFPSNTAANMYHWFAWRRQSNLIITVNGDAVQINGLIQPTELHSISYLHRAAVTTVVAPNQLRPVVTNDVVTFEATARGDLGEFIAGVDTDFTLENITSESESLTKAFPGGFQLENFPLDEGLLVIIETTGGTPTLLVETTDWTMDYATGAGTWVTDQSGSDIVEASYQHVDSPGSSPHGQLLNTTGTTDENGQAFARVRYEDGFLVVTGDRLTATMEE